MKGSLAVLGAALAVAAIALGVAIAHVTALGASAMADADAASGRLDWTRAIARARDAAQAVAPGSPWPERGAARLSQIARDAEARGDADTALRAYGALRTAALSTIGPLGGSRWREAADEGLARLARAPTAEGPPPRDEDAADATLRDLHEGEAHARFAPAALAVAALLVLGGLGAMRRAGAVRELGRALVAAGFLVYACTVLLN